MPTSETKTEAEFQFQRLVPHVMERKRHLPFESVGHSHSDKGQVGGKRAELGKLPETLLCGQPPRSWVSEVVHFKSHLLFTPCIGTRLGTPVGCSQHCRLCTEPEPPGKQHNKTMLRRVSGRVQFLTSFSTRHAQPLPCAFAHPVRTTWNAFPPLSWDTSGSFHFHVQ